MTDKTADKKTESINALKNANKHLADPFTDLNKKDNVIASCASDLTYVARQCGELTIKTYVGNALTATSLKAFLEAVAKNLERARA